MYQAINFSEKKNLKIGEKAFEICGPILWNNLPCEIKTAVNTETFKKLMKMTYFKAVFNVSLYCVKCFSKIKCCIN